MSLIKFRDYLGKRGDGKSPPSVIRAQDLDDNFASLKLVPDKLGIYKVDTAKDGSTLNFQASNRPVRWIEISICVDGTSKKMMVLGTDPY